MLTDSLEKLTQRADALTAAHSEAAVALAAAEAQLTDLKARQHEALTAADLTSAGQHEASAGEVAAKIPPLKARLDALQAAGTAVAAERHRAEWTNQRGKIEFALDATSSEIAATLAAAKTAAMDVRRHVLTARQLEAEYAILQRQQVELQYHLGEIEALPHVVAPRLPVLTALDQLPILADIAADPDLAILA